MINQLPHIQNTDKNNFFLIAGPCVVEGEDIVFDIAKKLKAITDRLEIPFIFKASYRKANRSRLDSFTGIGNERALSILNKIKTQLELPILTDIHTPTEANIAARYADVLQIPAFLCRQTDLLVAAAKTGKIVNIKKGQFLAPESMKHQVQKVIDSGNSNVMLTERGTMLGYGDLVVDFCGITEMKKNKVPVILDITHSVQKPNQESGVSGGRPDMIETLAKAGIAVGVDGIFIETHPNPSEAKSDGTNMLPIDELEELLIKLKSIHKAL